MEKVITVSTYDIPSVVNRWVDLGLKPTDYDRSKKILVQIKHPSGFEDNVLSASNLRNGPAVAIHKRINGKVLHPITRVTLRVYQIVDQVKQDPVPDDPKPLNPDPKPTEQKPSLIKTVLSGKVRPKDWKTMSVEQAMKRKKRLATIAAEVKESSPLKPVGLNGKAIMCGDDVDYSRGVALIKNIMRAQEEHNLIDMNTSPTQKKLIQEYYDAFSFCGISVVIGMYLALGEKARGKGDLSYFMSWYQNELSTIFSPTSLGELKKKAGALVNGMKFANFRKAPNPGFSIKQAEKIIGDFFTDEYTGQPLRMKDLKSEVYQPVFFDDEQTRAYTKAETPNARIVDVILDTGLNPLYFQSRKINVNGEEKLSLGPVRRSFELPIAQYNSGITLVSFGADAGYQESEEKFEGMNPAQVAFLNKRKSYRTDYLDARKYMEDNAEKVNYVRIESGSLYGVMANSISKKDLQACVESAEKRTIVWANTDKPVLKIEWS
jgi:hypothetical protein